MNISELRGKHRLKLGGRGTAWKRWGSAEAKGQQNILNDKNVIFCPQ